MNKLLGLKNQIQNQMYSTTLTNAQWQGIKNLLPQHERKRKYDLRLYGMRYYIGIKQIVNGGCYLKNTQNGK